MTKKHKGLARNQREIPRLLDDVREGAVFVFLVLRDIKVMQMINQDEIGFTSNRAHRTPKVFHGELLLSVVRVQRLVALGDHSICCVLDAIGEDDLAVSPS